MLAGTPRINGGGSGGGGSLSIGSTIGGGTPTQALYTDNFGNLFSDSLFTRDSITKLTNIAANFVAPSDFVQTVGTGLNDVSIQSQPTATVGATLTITIDIGDPTSPNVFNWADSLGGSGLHVAMAGGAITLPGSVGNWVIQFQNITGHTSGDTFVSTMDAVVGGFTIGNFPMGGNGSFNSWSDVAAGTTSFFGVGTIPGALSNGTFLATFGNTGDAHNITDLINGTYRIDIGASTGSNKSQLNLNSGTINLGASDGTWSSGFGATWKAATFQSHNTQFTLPDAIGAVGSVMTDVSGNGVLSMQPGGMSSALTHGDIFQGNGSNVATAINLIADTSDVPSVEYTSRFLTDAGSYTAVDWGGRQLRDANGSTVNASWGGGHFTIPSLATTPQYETPADNATVTANGATQLILNPPGGTMTSVTIIVPATPVNGQQFWITSVQAITTINWNGAVINAPTSFVIGTPIHFVYSTSISTGAWLAN